MSAIVCPKGCCQLKITDYSLEKHNFAYNNTRFKAGVFIYDPQMDSVLIIQSKGNLWGAPKGTLIPSDKTFTDCALREVLEETGLIINPVKLTKIFMINNNVSYFYTEMSQCDVFIQDHIPDNDANGIGWIKTKCLEECAENGMIDLNHHFCIIYWKFLGKRIYRKKE